MAHEHLSPLLSKRSQQHLMQLHRSLNGSARTLDRALSAFLAAVQACDATTQQQYFALYQNEVIAHQRSVRQLTQFIEHRLQITLAPIEIDASFSVGSQN